MDGRRVLCEELFVTETSMTNSSQADVVGEGYLTWANAENHDLMDTSVEQPPTIA